jgi:hypothetical protein
MDVGAFRGAMQVLERAAFEGGNGARVLGKAITRLERAATLESIPAATLHRIESSLVGSRAVLERATAAGVGAGVTTESLGAAHRTAGNVLAMINGSKAAPTYEMGLRGIPAPPFDALRALGYLLG